MRWENRISCELPRGHVGVHTSLLTGLTGWRQPHLGEFLLAAKRAQVGPVERRQRSPLPPMGEAPRPRRERVAVAEPILSTIGSRRHRAAMLEADPVAAIGLKRVDVVEHEVLDVSVGMLGAKESGVQHLSSCRCELSTATADLGSQVLLPDGQVFESNVVIGPGLDYEAVRCRSVNPDTPLGHRGRHLLLVVLS